MEFITINKNHELYYGGKQGWWREDDSVFGEYGCGVISMCNMEILLAKKFPKEIAIKEIFYDINNIDYEEYRNYVDKRYKTSYYFSRIKFLSRLGLLPWTMKSGLKFFMSQFGMKVKIKWAPTLRKKKILHYIDDMISKGIPIVASYFVFNRNNKLEFYIFDKSQIKNGTSCTSHYFNIVDKVNITELNEDYFVVSSWGEKYYIKVNDWIDKLSYFTNVLYCRL